VTKTSWFSSWTVFYWGWWIAWSPFVGMFIARISKGRTIREFILGVLLAPTAVSVLWMTGFGDSALYQEIYKRVAADPQEVARGFKYQPRSYLVADLDSEHQLARTPEGEWLIAPDAKAVAHPTGVLVKPEGEGTYVTKGGTAVEYLRGVLVKRGTREPYYADEGSAYHGPVRARMVELTLGGYLTSPVLNRDGRTRIDTTATAMFFMLKAYPWAGLTALVGTLCVVLFFVTSSDSASMVADIIASGGREDPALGSRLFWGILEGLLAAVLLLAGGLVALQTGSITIGLPFCVIILLMCVSLTIGLKREVKGRIPAEHKAHIAGEPARGKAEVK